MRRKWPAVIAAAVLAVVVVVAGVVALLGTTSGSSTTGRVRVLQFNMCGHVCRDSSHDKIAGVVDVLADVHPAAVSLNEVCRSQLTGVAAGTAERGWVMHARFIVTQPDECTGSDDYGNALLTRSRISETTRLTYAAQDKGNPEHRGLLCVTAALGRRPTHVCTTHIVDSTDDPVGDVRRTQIASAARRVSSFGGPVVLMGDFNARPPTPAMSVLYSRRHGSGAHGMFDEVGQGPHACRCGEPTHRSGAKYDYVFVSPRDFAVALEQTRTSRYSDHLALLGELTPR